MHIFKNPNFDFVRWKYQALALSWIIILIGIGYACTSKVKRSTAITVVAVWYLVWKVISAGLGSLG